MRGRLENERGITLLETLLGLLIIMMVAGMYVNYIKSHTIQKERQLTGLHLEVLVVKYLEEASEGVKLGEIGKGTRTEVEDYNNKKYTVTIEVEDTKLHIDPTWSYGELHKIRVNVGVGKQGKEAVIYVYNE